MYFIFSFRFFPISVSCLISVSRLFSPWERNCVVCWFGYMRCQSCYTGMLCGDHTCWPVQVRTPGGQTLLLTSQPRSGASPALVLSTGAALVTATSTSAAASSAVSTMATTPGQPALQAKVLPQQTQGERLHCVCHPLGCSPWDNRTGWLGVKH